MPKCCVPYCANSSVDNTKVSFHEFPHETPLFVETWLKKIGRPNWRPGVRSVVCSDHFVKYDFDRKGKLRCGSFPSKFPEEPSKKRRKKFQFKIDWKSVEGEVENEDAPSGPLETKPDHVIWQLCPGEINSPANVQHQPVPTQVTSVVSSFSLQACRICGEISSSNISIFSEDGAKAKLIELIQHLPIKVTPNDLLPVHMCMSCISCLESFHELVTTSRLTNDTLVGKLPAQIKENIAQTPTLSKGNEKEKHENSFPEGINVNCTFRVLVLELPNGDQKPINELLTYAVNDLSNRISPKELHKIQSCSKMMIVNLNSGKASYVDQMSKALEMFFSNSKVQKQDQKSKKEIKQGILCQRRSHISTINQECYDTDKIQSRLVPTPSSVKLGSSPALLLSPTEQSTASESSVCQRVLQSTTQTINSCIKRTHSIEKSNPPNQQATQPVTKSCQYMQPVVKVTRISHPPLIQCEAHPSKEKIPLTHVSSKQEFIPPSQKSDHLLMKTTMPSNQSTDKNINPFCRRTSLQEGQQTSPTENALHPLQPCQAKGSNQNLLVTGQSSDSGDPQKLVHSAKSAPCKNFTSLHSEPKAIVKTGSRLPNLNLSRLKEGLMTKLCNGQQFKAGDKIIGIVVRGNENAGEVQKKILAAFKKENGTSVTETQPFKQISHSVGGTSSLSPTFEDTSSPYPTIEDISSLPSTVESSSPQEGQIRQKSHQELCENSFFMEPKLSLAWSKRPFVADALQKMFMWRDCVGAEASATELVCRVCSVSFQNQKLSEAHLQQHSDLQCGICFQFFLTSECTQKHIKSFHKDIINEEGKRPPLHFPRRSLFQKSVVSKFRRFQCSQCETRFKQRDSLERHMVIHKAKEIMECARPTCQVCGRKVDSDEALREHMIVHTKREANLCDVCGDVFKGWNSFQQHVGRVHGERYNNFVHKCTHCKKLFKNLHKLQAHIEKHEKEKDVTYICTTCGKLFYTMHNLKRHEELHLAPKIECRFCDMRFHRNDHLRQHVTRHHVNNNNRQQPRQYRCRMCVGVGDESLFGSMRELLQHYLMDHGCPRGTLGGGRSGRGVALHCGLCDRSFTNSTLLNHHKLWHAGKRPYHCHTCGAGFMTTDRLHNHIRLHTNERPFSCDICGKSFRCRPVLMQHKETHAAEHTKHPCSVCGRRFSRKDQLGLHMRTHTGEKPWKCLLCGSRFRAKGDCNKHICGVHKRSTTDIPNCQAKVEEETVPPQARAPTVAAVRDEEEEDGDEDEEEEVEEEFIYDDDEDDEDLETEEPAIQYAEEIPS